MRCFHEIFAKKAWEEISVISTLCFCNFYRVKSVCVYLMFREISFQWNKSVWRIFSCITNKKYESLFFPFFGKNVTRDISFSRDFSQSCSNRRFDEIFVLPLYSGKQMVSGLYLIFCSNKSFLLRNKIIDVSTNHLLLQIESNSFIDSIIRFISSSSASTKS